MSDPAQDNQQMNGDDQSGVSPWSGGDQTQDSQDWNQSDGTQTEDVAVNQWGGGDDQTSNQMQQVADDQGVTGGQQQLVGGGVGQTEQAVGRPTKEVEPIKSTVGEALSVVEMERQRELGEVDPELKGYVKEEQKENLKLDDKVMQGDKVLVGPAEPADMPQVTLPMTKQSFLANVHGPVKKSATWLAVFCKRLISKFHGRVVYAADES